VGTEREARMSRPGAEATMLAIMSPDMQLHRDIPQRDIAIRLLERITMREAATATM
jgi:hypothetical protein